MSSNLKLLKDHEKVTINFNGNFIFRLIDVHKVLRVLLPHLRTIVFWMANALELLHFFHSYMEDYVGQTEAEEETAEGPSLVASFQDEITAELEEVVMYTFQQSVYYLTKVRLL